MLNRNMLNLYVSTILLTSLFVATPYPYCEANALDKSTSMSAVSDEIMKQRAIPNAFIQSRAVYTGKEGGYLKFTLNARAMTGAHMPNYVDGVLLIGGRRQKASVRLPSGSIINARINTFYLKVPVPSDLMNSTITNAQLLNISFR